MKNKIDWKKKWRATDKVKGFRHRTQIENLKQEIGDLYCEIQLLKKFLNKTLQAEGCLTPSKFHL